MASALLVLLSTKVGSESITLTTYYPAPSGIYNQMITTGMTYLARESGEIQVGGPVAISSENLPQEKLVVNGSIRLNNGADANGSTAAKGYRIANVSLPINPNDVATKRYVDNATSGSFIAVKAVNQVSVSGNASGTSPQMLANQCVGTGYSAFSTGGCGPKPTPSTPSPASNYPSVSCSSLGMSSPSSSVTWYVANLQVYDRSTQQYGTIIYQGICNCETWTLCKYTGS